jgi:octopine/nopaline transport system substrate-binding protein
MKFVTPWLVMVWILAVALSPAAGDSAALTIATEGYLRPYNLTRSDGTLDGYEIDLARYLCHHMRRQCRFVTRPFDGLIAGLEAGQYDAIMAGLTATDERRRIISFSRSYSFTPHVFVALRGTSYSQLPHSGTTVHLLDDAAAVQVVRDQLAGATIGAVKGSVDQSILNDHLLGKATLRLYRSGEEALLDLKNGRIDIMLNSRAFLAASVLLPGNENLVLTGPFWKGGLLASGVGVGVRKEDSDLLIQFNAAIAAASADGTIAHLSARWFKFDATP